MRPQSFETSSFEPIFIWDHNHLRPHSSETTVIWDHIHFRPQSFETTFIWDHIRLRPHSFETTVIWDHRHLRPHSFETTFIWDHSHLRPQSFETTFILDHIHFRSLILCHVKEKLFWFTVCKPHFYDLPSTSLTRDLTLSAKTVAFVEVTCQTICSYSIAFLFEMGHEIFPLWVFRPTQKEFFFSSFIFSWKLKLLWRLDKGNGQERKTCNSLTWSKLDFRGCNPPFQARGMKSFQASAVF